MSYVGRSLMAFLSLFLMPISARAGGIGAEKILRPNVVAKEFAKQRHKIMTILSSESSAAINGCAVLLMDGMQDAYERTENIAIMSDAAEAMRNGHDKSMILKVAIAEAGVTERGLDALPDAVKSDICEDSALSAKLGLVATEFAAAVGPLLVSAHTKLIVAISEDKPVGSPEGSHMH